MKCLCAAFTQTGPQNDEITVLVLRLSDDTGYPCEMGFRRWRCCSVLFQLTCVIIVHFSFYLYFFQNERDTHRLGVSLGLGKRVSVFSQRERYPFFH